MKDGDERSGMEKQILAKYQPGGDFAYLEKKINKIENKTQGRGNECKCWPSFEACKTSAEVNQTHLA